MDLAVLFRDHPLPPREIGSAYRVLEHHIIDAQIAWVLRARFAGACREQPLGDAEEQIDGDDEKQQQFHDSLPVNSRGWFSSAKTC